MELIKEELVKKMLGSKYFISKKIGMGGMGSVYKVISYTDKCAYAAKIIDNGMYDFGVSEARIMVNLNHPYLPCVKEIFTYSQYTIIIMEYINGCNLLEYVSQKGYLKNADVNLVLRQLIDVLIYLHGQDPPIIYRDLKPSNIMINKDFDVKLIDFGTARNYRFNLGRENVESDTISLGTPGFAAPEQMGVYGMQTDVRSDIYSLGATLYYIITGIDISKPPFEVKSIYEVRSDIDYYYDELIDKCLRKNPADRFSSVREVLSYLDYMQENKNVKGKVLGKWDKLKNKTIPINIMITHSGKDILEH